MKKLIATLAAIALSGTVLLASGATSYESKACSKDLKTVTLVFALDNDAVTSHPAAPAHVTRAFRNAAGARTAEDLQTAEGFKAFQAGLDEQDVAALVAIAGAPQVTGTCSAPSAPSN